jgi:hypothetical protein
MVIRRGASSVAVYGTLEIYKSPSQPILRVESLLFRYVRSSDNHCAMFDPLFAALALLIVGAARAQVSAPNCSDSTGSYAWVSYTWLVAEFLI